MSRSVYANFTQADLDAKDAAEDSRRDRVAAYVDKQRGLLPTIAEWRAARDYMTSRELISLARSAARLELRGVQFDAEDRADVAARIVADVLAMIAAAAPTTLAAAGNGMPRRDSQKVTLTALCDRAKTLRRTIEREREREAADAERAQDEYANSADALNPARRDFTPAKAAAIMARSEIRIAELAASSICESLGLPDAVDSPAWSVLYQWTRGATAEACAIERGVQWATYKMRVSRGAKMIREFWSAEALAAKLTLGASSSLTVGTAPADVRTVVGGSGARHTYPLQYAGDMLTARADVLTLVMADASTERGSDYTLGEYARENFGRVPKIDRPKTAEDARALCVTRRCRKRTSKLTRPDRREHVAAALSALARDYARNSKRAERGVSPAKSALA